MTFAQYLLDNFNTQINIMPDDFKIDIESLDINKLQSWDLTEFNEQIDYVFNRAHNDMAVSYVDDFILSRYESFDISEDLYLELIEEAKVFIDERLDTDYTAYYLDTTFINVRLTRYSNYEYLQPAYIEDDIHDPDTYLRQILQQLNIDVEKKSFDESAVTQAWFMHEIENAFWQWHFVFTGKISLAAFINSWVKNIVVPEWTPYWIHNSFTWTASPFTSQTVKDLVLPLRKSFDSQFDRWELDIDLSHSKQYDYSITEIFGDEDSFQKYFTIQQ